MFEHFAISQLRLMTNNPVKVSALEGLGLDVVERLAITTGRTAHNEKYLDTKAGKLGHLLSDD